MIECNDNWCHWTLELSLSSGSTFQRLSPQSNIGSLLLKWGVYFLTNSKCSNLKTVKLFFHFSKINQ